MKNQLNGNTNYFIFNTHIHIYFHYNALLTDELQMLLKKTNKLNGENTNMSALLDNKQQQIEKIKKKCEVCSVLIIIKSYLIRIENIDLNTYTHLHYFFR